MPTKCNPGAAMLDVAVLFARANSVYKSIPGLDVYDLARDARTYTGTSPVVAHPPCRSWGRLRYLAKPRVDERQLADFAVAAVRRCGGVLEHPASSTLWAHAALPAPGRAPDQFGGWTAQVQQCDWGHRAQKLTWLYIVGVHPDDLPPLPPPGQPSHVVERMCVAERERTPLPFATWLVDLASRTRAECPPVGNTGRTCTLHTPTGVNVQKGVA